MTNLVETACPGILGPAETWEDGIKLLGQSGTVGLFMVSWPNQSSATGTRAPMHPAIYREFESICRGRFVGGRVLEIGAVPSKSSLLCMDALENATEKVGINLNGPRSYKDFTILKGDANAMTCFSDEYFDLVLCNAVLEHDRFFYKTVAEVKRVTRPGGVIVFGVPGYQRIPALERIQSALRRLPIFRSLAAGKRSDWLFTATLTFRLHDAPGDYYRFSLKAVEEVFFEGCSDVRIASMMLTPRIIGSGVRP